MKATGIVRRIDDLGRVVVPREIRNKLRIREGDPLEILVEEKGMIVLKKYSPMGELEDFAKEYADSLHENLGHMVMITDRDMVIAISGVNRRQFLGKTIGSVVESCIENRETIVMNNIYSFDENAFVINMEDKENKENGIKSQVVAPIVCQGDSIGSVIIRSNNKEISETEIKSAEITASFLGKHTQL